MIAGKFGQILTTQNGGESWILRTELLIDDQITSVSFNSENVGWVVANECYGTPLGGGECNGRLFQTSDGGFSWIEQLIIGNSFVDVQAVSDQVVYGQVYPLFKVSSIKLPMEVALGLNWLILEPDISTLCFS